MTADVGHALASFGQNILEPAVGGDARVHQRLAVGDDGIDGLPLGDFVLLAVGVLVADGVAAEAVGQRVEQHRALALLEDFELALHRVDHSQRVEAVDALGVHLGGGNAGANAGQHVIRHGLALGLAAHAVAVVEDVEQNRHAALLAVLRPQRVELIHAGEVQRFPHGAAAQRAIADVADDEAVFVVDLLIQRSAGRDGRGAADDGVVRIHAEGQEERVHGAAHAHVEAGLAGEDFRQRAVQDEADGQLLHAVALAHLLNGAQGAAAEEAFHDLHQLVIAQLLNGREGLGEDFGVASVGTELIVVGRHEVRLTDARGLLTDGKVRRSRIGGFHAVVHALGLDGREHALELAQNGDIAIDANQIFILEVGALLLNGLVVGVYGNVLKVDCGLRADLLRAVV